MTTPRSLIYIIGLLGTALLLLLACANPGSGPDGGPYDETPPVLVSVRPTQGDTLVKRGNKITLTFSENVKLENANEKVVISPAQLEMPEIKVSGRRVTVELMDTLRPNTTYTVDFSDAISDATEGNPLGRFTYFFSTGNSIDTMEVSGTVLAADNLDPVKGILVGLHSNFADTAFTSLPLERIARTDEHGRFTIKGVRQGAYRIFALQDMDGDFRYSPGETLAFLRDSIVTGCFADIRHDTLWTDTVHYDTILAVPYTHFLPDDITLQAFKETSAVHGLLKMLRPTPEVFTAYFSAPNDEPPVLQGLNFNAADAFIEDRSAHLDTITYWIKDDAVRQNDTLQFTYTYAATNDSTRQLYSRTDTLSLTPKLTNARLLKQKAEEEAKWQKELQKRHKRGDYSQETPAAEPLKVDMVSPAKITPADNVFLEAKEPITALDTTRVHLLLKKDSLSTQAPLRIVQRLTGFTLMSEWRPGQQYELVLDSGAVTGLSGKICPKTVRDVSVTKAEEVGSLFLTLSGCGADTARNIVVQLLQADKVCRQTVAEEGRADFFYLKSGDYTVRCFFDDNGNRLWDTGNYAEGLQPETVYYLPQTVKVKANWDTEETWQLDGKPLSLQKPAKTQKTGSNARRRTAHDKNLERERSRH